MGRSRSKRQVVVLDSCFSGAFAEGLLAKDDKTVDIRTQLGGEGRAVLTSSSSTEYSFEQKGEDLSIYTHFLLQGIKTGEADQDGDGIITIDELHEYASQKVREAQPAMKPEIYAIREGFKIRLLKVPPGDPKQKYRKEVTRFIKRGEISFIGRRTLDILKTNLGIEAAEAKAIEDEVLEPYRQVFRENLQQYEQAFSELLERDENITETDRNELQHFQQVLGLRNEDTIPIEAQVTARFKTRKQNLQTYEQAFSEALRQEYLLTETTQTRLQQMRQQMGLNDSDVEAIEARLTSEIERYRQNLQQYEQLFITATKQKYPLSEAKRNELQQQQQALGLTDVEIAPIEAKLTTQIETYHQKLQQYEQALIKATQCKHHPDEATRKQLQQTWQTLGLSETDVGVTEAQIKAQIETHQANLRQYEQEFTDATEQEYPLNKAKCDELRQRQQALNLTNEDVEPIETRIKNSIEGHLQKLQQYEEVLTEAIQFEYPLSDATREDLRRFQQVLELGDADVARIKEKVRLQKESGLKVDEASLSTDKTHQKPSEDTKQSEQIPQEIIPQAASDQYEQKIKQTVDKAFPVRINTTQQKYFLSRTESILLIIIFFGVISYSISWFNTPVNTRNCKGLVDQIGKGVIPENEWKWYKQNCL